MVQLRQRKPKGMERERTLKFIYDGGHGLGGEGETYVVKVTTASAKERLAVEAAAADFSSEAKGRVSGSKFGDIMASSLKATTKASATYHKRGELAPDEEVLRSVIIRHIVLLGIEEENEEGKPEVFEALFETDGGDKSWSAMSDGERNELMTVHASMFAYIIRAIIPKAQEEIVGKSETAHD